MTSTFDTILKAGTVVNQDGEGVRDIGVTGGRIAAIGDLARATGGAVIEAKGLHVLPGVIDSQQRPFLIILLCEMDAASRSVA